MTEPEFATSRLKLARAEEHFKNYSSEKVSWINEQPYAFSKEFNPETGRHSVLLDVRKPPPLERWSLIAGDCFHNLRSALDHLTYGLGIRDSGQKPPPDAGKLQFPIVTDPDKWPTTSSRRLRALNASSQARIEELQPYKRKHPQLPPLLTLLSYFDNADKHRLVALACQHVVGATFSSHEVKPFPKTHTLRSQITSTTRMIMFFDTNPPDPNFQYDYDPTIEITISHPQGPNSSHVTILDRMLDLLVEEVRQVINHLSH